MHFRYVRTPLLGGSPGLVVIGLAVTNQNALFHSQLCLTHGPDSIKILQRKVYAMLFFQAFCLATQTFQPIKISIV